MTIKNKHKKKRENDFYFMDYGKKTWGLLHRQTGHGEYMHKHAARCGLETREKNNG
jgi:hypothetical protein